MLPSQMPIQRTSACSAFAYATASSELRMSGSVTISSSGVPARFKSMPVDAVEVLVQRLAGVFLEVGARQLHADVAARGRNDRDAAAGDHRVLVLLIW